MQAADEVDSACDREIAVLFSIFAQQQNPVYPIELGPVSRRLSPALSGLQHPIDFNVLPPPERFLKKKKTRSLVKKSSPQSLQVKVKPAEDSKYASQSDDGDEYDRELEKLLLSVDG
jgi:hypothetical protein